MGTISSVFSRRVVVAGILAASLVVGAGCRRDDPPLVIDTAGGSIADSAPTTLATGVAAMLTDENVFGLLDTAYAAIIATDQLGQANTTNERVRDLASAALSQNVLGRSGIKATADRLHITAVLPDRDVIKDHQKAMEELRTKKGAEFDAAYLSRVIETREALIDEVDDALESNSVKHAAVKQFLTEIRANLESDRQKAVELRRTVGG
jgi:putative membrane protein